MSAILKFDFQKRKQLRFSEVNYLSYTKKDPILHVTTTFSLKQEETRTSSGPIPHPLRVVTTSWLDINYTFLHVLKQTEIHIILHNYTVSPLCNLKVG